MSDSNLHGTPPPDKPPLKCYLWQDHGLKLHRYYEILNRLDTIIALLKKVSDHKSSDTTMESDDDSEPMTPVNSNLILENDGAVLK